MKFRTKKTIFLSILGTATGSLVLGSVLSLSSCKSQETYNYELSLAVAKKLYQDYKNELMNAFGDSTYLQVTSENEQQVKDVVNKYLRETNYLIDYLNQQTQSMSKDNFIDLNIWLRGIQFELSTKLKLLDANIRYLIASINDSFEMTNYHKSFHNNVLRVATGYNSKTVVEKETELKNIKKYISDVQSNLQQGLENGVTWSGVLAKHTIGSLLQSLYSNELIKFAKGEISSLKNISGSLFKSDAYTNWANQNGNPENIANLVNECQSQLDTLINFIMGEYYDGIKYGKTNGEDSLSFTPSTSKPNEEDNSFSIKDGSTTKYIVGLGLNEANLNTKDIGVGFSGLGGQKIYEGLLQKHTNITNVSTADQYKLGTSQVDDIKNAMQSVANEIANLKVGSGNQWEETYMYDEDSSGDQYGSVQKTETLRAAGSLNVDLAKFFEWLNSDQFFNGRDRKADQAMKIGATEVGKPNTGNQSRANTNNDYAYEAWPRSAALGTDADYVRRVIGYIGDTDPDTTITSGDAGNLYVKYITQNLSPSTIQDATPKTFAETPNSVAPAAAYIGASKAVRQYLEYKKDTAGHLTQVFEKTSWDYTLRTATGGAAFASGGPGASSWVNDGSGGFFLDVNPYFGLQKWSMSTLANHEGITGHVFQFNYADEHPGNQNAIEIDSTAYAEGWGLFSEWLATQLGVYGAPADLSANIDGNGQLSNIQGVLTLPVFGADSKTTDITAYSDQYEFANGTYWIKPYSQNVSNPSQEGNNQSYYDSLQYFGFLNERQLRAMRITVDVGLHSGKDGSFAIGSGFSLNDARKYLRSNSGLGLDDVKRETKRYLEYTGQATSYYNGLIEMQNYFIKAKTAYEKVNSGQRFMDWKTPSLTNANTAPLFNLILRNGSTPLEALNWAVDQYLASLYK